MPLKDFVKEYVFEKKKGQNEGAQRMEELPIEFKEMAEKNAEQLDKHMIWVSGGALALISTIFVSDSFIAICLTNYLIVPLLGFGICILSVISSYRAVAKVLNSMPRVNEIIPKLLQFMSSVKEEDDMEKAWEIAERQWKRLTRTVKWGLRFVIATRLLNSLAYITFMAGMISFLIFGTLGINSSTTCMKNRPSPRTQTHQGKPHITKKASQVSGPMFQQLVDSIPATLSGSNTNTDTDTGTENTPANGEQ